MEVELEPTVRGLGAREGGQLKSLPRSGPARTAALAPPRHCSHQLLILALRAGRRRRSRRRAHGGLAPLGPAPPQLGPTPSTALNPLPMPVVPRRGPLLPLARAGRLHRLTLPRRPTRGEGARGDRRVKEAAAGARPYLLAGAGEKTAARRPRGRGSPPAWRSTVEWAAAVSYWDGGSRRRGPRRGEL
ncbi:unnamed protein product [Urochloa humidicola]